MQGPKLEGLCARRCIIGEMRPTPRVPSLSVPRTDKPFIGGAATSLMLHGAMILFVVWGSERASEGLFRTAGGAGPAGGGGGGGGERIEYLELPPYVPPAPTTTAVVSPRAVEVPVPRPQLREIIDRSEPVRFLPPLERVVAPRLGSGPGSGGGAGSGTGSGGGTGSGEGTGLGSGRGPGTGGEGGAGFGPQLQQALMPPADWPEAVRGMEFRVRFLVDARGRVSRVEVDPRIPDPDYRKKFLDKMKQYVFAPARSGDGTPVAAPFEAWISF